MEKENLVVRINTDDNMHSNDMTIGQIEKEIAVQVRDEYLEGSFYKLIGYMLKNTGGLSNEMQNTAGAINGYLSQAESDPNANILIQLYDDENNRINDRPDCYLNDLVKEMTGDVDLVNMSITLDTEVGYR